VASASSAYFGVGTKQKRKKERKEEKRPIQLIRLQGTTSPPGKPSAILKIGAVSPFSLIVCPVGRSNCPWGRAYRGYPPVRPREGDQGNVSRTFGLCTDHNVFRQIQLTDRNRPSSSFSSAALNADLGLIPRPEPLRPANTGFPPAEPVLTLRGNARPRNG